FPPGLKAVGAHGRAEPAAGLPAAPERRHPWRGGRPLDVSERMPMPRFGANRLHRGQRYPETPFIQPHDAPPLTCSEFEAIPRGGSASVKCFTLGPKIRGRDAFFGIGAAYGRKIFRRNKSAARPI